MEEEEEEEEEEKSLSVKQPLDSDTAGPRKIVLYCEIKDVKDFNF